ncbi:MULTISPECIES: hypothetical protein [unclassified Psychrobacter]|uniref:hypothetical protein n=1 Tax=unclassified Psychrobacter TaxID=196806 RepID=UPI00078D1458|nr:hypothetical protein [Psychrobacter sp. P2G3]AMN50331.1 hypothetical protein AK823_10995 [Psychrobacter sp. P2G3]
MIDILFIEIRTSDAYKNYAMRQLRNKTMIPFSKIKGVLKNRNAEKGCTYQQQLGKTNNKKSQAVRLHK